MTWATTAIGSALLAVGGYYGGWAFAAGETAGALYVLALMWSSE